MKKILVLATFLFLSIISFVTFADINNSNVLVTSVKFTATLTASLITGNKVKIDYGKGLMAMTCVDKTCTLSSKSLPSSLVPIVYKIGIYNTHNALQSNLQTGTYALFENIKTTLDTVTRSPVSSIKVDGTAFKFTTILSAPLTKGYKVKIDYGNGLAVMTCSAKICVLSANIALTKSISHTYKVGIYNAQNQLQGKIFTNSHVFSGVALPSSNTAFNKNATLVIRVVGTNPQWGQELEPAWAGASPVKTAEGYQLYDLEIGRYSPPKEVAKLFKSDGNGGEVPSPIPAYVTLYKFPNGSLDKTASTVRSIPVQSIDNSSQTAQALKNLISLVLDKENPTRIVIAYSGHGSPWTMFEGDITLDEGAALFDSIRLKRPGIPLILDFSTNCDVGYFDFAVHYVNHADYLLASDKLVGGFSSNISSWYAGSPEEIAYNAANHDYSYDKFFKASNSLDQAFDEIIAARQSNWLLGSNSIKDNALEQSLSIYKLSEFGNLMLALKSNGLNPVLDLPRNSNDLATYVYETNNTSLVGKLEKFRIRYASDRNLVTWQDNSQGFSVYFTTDLQTYLNKI
jgi:hypothetical protein